MDLVPHELPLNLACLFLGNYPAFRVLDRSRTPLARDEGSLHTAALLALPKFVKWFMEKYDANTASEHLDNMIPLALACSSAFQPWSKIANEQSDWKTRRRETMKLLAPRTNLRWRLRGKTVLHFAIEKGLEVTEAMIEALDVDKDPDRFKNYSYVDKDGVKYSPDQYVEISGIESAEKQALITCLLTKGGFQHPSAGFCVLT